MRRFAPFLLLLAACSGESPPAPPRNPITLMNPRGDAETAPARFRVRFETTKGAFVVEAVRDWAPHGVDRLWNLVKVGYFDQTPFYRVKRDFVAQFGFHHEPAVNEAWRNAYIDDDRPGKQRNRRGTVAFGQMGVPNSRSIHIFVNYVDNVHLDGGFPPVGRVVEGMEVVDSIHAGYGEAPQQPAIERRGRAYLDELFPKLDYILRAGIVQ